MNQSLSYELDAVMPAVRATGLLVSLATFSAPTGATTDNPAGALDDEGFPTGDYTPIDGLIDIACTAPPLSTGEGIAAREAKGLEELMTERPLHVLLDDYYPAVVTGWTAGWCVSIDGIDYDVMGAEPDSQRQMTRVYVRLVKQ